MKLIRTCLVAASSLAAMFTLGERYDASTWQTTIGQFMHAKCWPNDDGILDSTNMQCTVMQWQGLAEFTLYSDPMAPSMAHPT
eukprot:1194313-Prorocentrum_minimum.AAC.3